MEKYKVVIKRSAISEIEDIPQKKIRQQIIKRIGQLASDPRPAGSKKLSGNDKYRIRQGNYRIIYGIETGVLTIIVIKVGLRKDVYRELS